MDGCKTEGCDTLSGTDPLEEASVRRFLSGTSVVSPLPNTADGRALEMRAEGSDPEANDEYCRGMDDSGRENPTFCEVFVRNDVAAVTLTVSLTSEKRDRICEVNGYAWSDSRDDEAD